VLPADQRIIRPSQDGNVTVLLGVLLSALALELLFVLLVVLLVELLLVLLVLRLEEGRAGIHSVLNLPRCQVKQAFRNCARNLRGQATGTQMAK
jgi:hypothetical protein